MLSHSTLSFLSELQEKSHTAYPEGGMLYTFVEASNQAHSRYPSSNDASPAPSLSELKNLSLFLQASQGEYLSKPVATHFVVAAQQLIEHLRADLNFDEMCCQTENGGHDMEFKLKMARRTDNRFFELELWWSID